MKKEVLKRCLTAMLVSAMCLTMGVTAAPTMQKAQAKKAEQDLEAREALQNLIMKTQYNSLDDVKEALRLEFGHISGVDEVEEVFAEEKTGNVKFACYDVNKDKVNELFILYPNKKLEVYDYADEMIVKPKSVKPLLTMKNVKEVRRGSTAKGTFFVKQTKKKKSTFTTCTFKKNTVKKGKKITAKKYKKNKKITFAKPDMTRDSLYVTSNSYIIDKSMLVAKIGDEEGNNPGRIVMKKDDEAEAGKASYRIFGEIFDQYNFRIVLGDNEKADFDEYFRNYAGVANLIPVLKGVLEGRDDYIITGFTPANGNTDGYYTIEFNMEGSKEDFHIRVYVENVGDETRVSRAETIGDTGMVYQFVQYHYGEDALAVDGEIYTPGLEMECFPTDEYIQQQGAEYFRSMKVAYPDKTVECKADSSVKFLLYSNTGTFSFDVDGKKASEKKIGFKSDLLNFLNPETKNGYGDAKSEVTWTAD